MEMPSSRAAWEIVRNRCGMPTGSESDSLPDGAGEGSSMEVTRFGLRPALTHSRTDVLIVHRNEAHARTNSNSPPARVRAAIRWRAHPLIESATVGANPGLLPTLFDRDCSSSDVTTFYLIEIRFRTVDARCEQQMRAQFAANC